MHSHHFLNIRYMETPRFKMLKDTKPLVAGGNRWHGNRV